MTLQELRAEASATDPFTFTVSTDKKNRRDLVIQQDGWILSGFRSNPIALWMHDHDRPIGTWANLKIEGGKMSATLKLAAKGTSEFIDTLWSLVEQGIVKAASVGFKAIDYDIQKDGTIVFKKQELREISLVSIPADADALKAMQLSVGVRDRLILGEERPGTTADDKIIPKQKGHRTMSLAERIRAKEAELTGLTDQITTLSEQEELTDDETVTLSELSAKAETLGGQIASLKKAEQALALNAKATKPGGRTSVPATARKERGKAELIFRSAYAIAKAHVTNRSVGEIILADFGGDKELDIVINAVSNPALTNVQGWAAELIDTQLGEFLDLLSPESVWAAMSGTVVVFDRNGAVRLPGRSTRTLGGSFIGEGAPIPVKQAQLTSILVAPFKLGVITTMTRELAQRSAPAAEPLFRQMMIEDTALAIDQAFLDAGAASAVRPGGLQTLGQGGASTGNTATQVMADLRDMVGDMITQYAGRRPVWVMNDIRRIGLLTLFSTDESARPFAAEVSQGRLLGYPIISSVSVPAGVVFLIDQAELAKGYGDSPAVDMSNQATLHMEDTAPLPLATGAQGSGVVATPMRSLFQTDSLGLRLVWDISWAVRRAGAVQFRTGMAW